MTTAIGTAILLVGLAMLGLAAGFARTAVQRARARETTAPADVYGTPRPDTYATPRRSLPRPYEMTRPDHRPAPAPSRPAGGYGAPGPGGYAVPGGRPGPTSPGSPRSMLIGAGAGAVLGIGALIAAAVVLISAMTALTHTLTTPQTAGGLRRDDTPSTQRILVRQRQRLAQSGMPRPLAAVYHPPSDADVSVLFIGSTGHLDSPAASLRDVLAGLARSTGAGDQRPVAYPAGRLQGTVLCLDRLLAGQSTLSSCGWADDSTLGVIATDGGDAPHTASLLLSMRDDMEQET